MPYYATPIQSEERKRAFAQPAHLTPIHHRVYTICTPMKDLFFEQKAQKGTRAERQARSHAASIRVFGKKPPVLVARKKAITVYPPPVEIAPVMKKRMPNEGMFGTVCKLLGVGNCNGRGKKDGMQIEQPTEMMEKVTVRKAGVRVVVLRPVRLVDESSSIKAEANVKVSQAAKEPIRLEVHAPRKATKKVLSSPLPNTILTPRTPLPPILTIESAQTLPSILKSDESKTEVLLPPSERQLNWPETNRLLLSED